MHVLVLKYLNTAASCGAAAQTGEHVAGSMRSFAVDELMILDHSLQLTVHHCVLRQKSSVIIKTRMYNVTHTKVVITMQ